MDKKIPPEAIIYARGYRAGRLNVWRRCAWMFVWSFVLGVVWEIGVKLWQ